MRLLHFPLGKPADTSAQLIRSWTARLKEAPAFGHEPVELPDPDRPEDPLRAVWRGEPFLFVAEPADLDRHFDGLDPDSIEILQDCAYFWVLTDSAGYTHPNLPDDRMVVLSWSSDSQNVVRSALKRLQQIPRLKGLSGVTDRVRVRISRLASGLTGPGCSVLILGPTGSGKEEVAQALAAAGDAPRRKIQAVSGAWLNMEPGMAMSELVGLARGRMEERIPGLLKHLTLNTMFIDDFESCPKNIQETLLRVMSVPEGEPARYRAVGADVESETDVWPIFATNRQVGSFMREDFLYRFGSRIVWLLPLFDRPADFPAIAHAIWAGIWAKRVAAAGDRRYEPLRSAAVKHLYGKELNWDGNVRTLAAILRLVVAEMCDPESNLWSQVEIIDKITPRGPGLLDWVASYGVRSARSARLAAEPDASAAPAPSVRRAGATDEDSLRGELLGLLRPDAAQIVDTLDKALRARVKPEDGEPRNDPGRHLIYGALVFLAGLDPLRPAGSADLKGALGISSGQGQKLCAEMTRVLTGDLTALCKCEGGEGVRFRFQVPHTILRRTVPIP